MQMYIAIGIMVMAAALLMIFEQLLEIKNIMAEKK